VPYVLRLVGKIVGLTLAIVLSLPLTMLLLLLVTGMGDPGKQIHLPAPLLVPQFLLALLRRWNRSPCIGVICSVALLRVRLVARVDACRDLDSSIRSGQALGRVCSAEDAGAIGSDCADPERPVRRQVVQGSNPAGVYLSSDPPCHRRIGHWRRGRVGQRLVRGVDEEDLPRRREADPAPVPIQQV
jgi:hypothetical protein